MSTTNPESRIFFNLHFCNKHIFVFVFWLWTCDEQDTHHQKLNSKFYLIALPRRISVSCHDANKAETNTKSMVSDSKPDYL